MLLSVSFICICACVPYVYPSCVSGAENGAANNRNYGQLRESFAGDVVCSAIIVWTWASMYRRLGLGFSFLVT